MTIQQSNKSRQFNHSIQSKQIKTTKQIKPNKSITSIKAIQNQIIKYEEELKPRIIKQNDTRQQIQRLKQFFEQDFRDITLLKEQLKIKQAQANIQQKVKILEKVRHFFSITNSELQSRMKMQRN